MAQNPFPPEQDPAVKKILPQIHRIDKQGHVNHIGEKILIGLFVLSNE